MSRVTSGRDKEGGRLAVHLQDFVAHYNGNDFKHTADSINMNPVLPSVGGTTVQSALENIQSIITSNGSGFISIGDADGYASGTYNINTVDTPTFVNAFNAALADNRLQNGGIILILAGTYTVTSTITIPAGISVMGEIGGTYLIGETVEQPLFNINYTSKDVRIGGDSGSGTVSILNGSNSEKVRFYNLSLFDNLNSTASSGTDPSMATVPMIQVEQGANFECHNVSFFGKLANGSTTNRLKTKCAIGTTSGIANSTSIDVQSCFFDGFKNGIVFNTQYGDQDYLTVSQCKARIYGKESASYTAAEDCFIYSSLANINVTNNYLISGGSNMKTFINIGATGGSTTNIKVIVTGNYGYVSSSTNSLIDNDSTVTFNGLIANNNWNIHNESSWYIVVGGADGDAPLGDIFGPNAINTLVTWGNSLNLETTVIVNPGTYTVTLSATAANNVCKLNFIGNKKGREYPVFDLDILSSATDSLDNKFVVLGNKIESIFFKTTTSFHSITPAFHALGFNSQNASNTMTIKDCIFYDVSLNIMDIGASALSDQEGNNTVVVINIEDCDFRQSGSFGSKLSLACPRAHHVYLKNLTFNGGYAANIGTELYSSVNINSNYYLENISTDMSTGVLDDLIHGATYGYFNIVDSLGKVYLNNCSIVVNYDFTNYALIDNALLTNSPPFDRWLYINALDISINNCLINGPNQLFQITGTSYPIPAAKLKPIRKLNIDNSKFVSGGIPCQISSDISDSSRDAIKITNSDFSSLPAGATNCISMLDVDLEPSSSTTFQSEVFINNCNFTNKTLSGTPVYDTYHEYVTSTNYDIHGIVQIYCRGFDLNFSNNRIYGAIFEPSSTHYTHFTGLGINTFNSDLGAISHITNTKISGNNIKIHNNKYSSGSASNTASCCYVRSTAININNNMMNFENGASVTANFAGPLFIDGNAISSFSGDGNIIGNIFGAHTLTGSFTALSRGFIGISSSTTFRGRITNNSYMSTTIDGVSNTTLVEDSSSIKWIQEGNKNQTDALIVRGNYGNLAIKNNANTPYIEAGIIPSVSTSSIGFANASTSTVTFNYSDTTSDQVAMWSIPLYGLIPSNAYIVSASVTVDIASNPSTTSIASLTYRDTSGTSTTSTNPLTTSGSTLTLSFSAGQKIVTAALGPVLELTYRINGNATNTFTADQMTITYRW